jgi:hypothetical protein
MSATICRHIKTNGRQCKSPSLGLSAFCYFHSRLHRRHRNLLENSSALAISTPNPGASTPGTPQNPIELDLPPVEDAESIQVSISLLIAALARNRIDAKRAAVLLYGLQLASTNAKSITIEPSAASIIRALTRTKSGLDLAPLTPALAPRTPGDPAKTIDRSASKPDPALPETPSESIYNENL